MIDAKEHRARYQAKKKLIAALPVTPEKNSPRELLKNGYVHPSIQDQFEQTVSELKNQVSDAPLSFTETASLSTWFDIHPEKIAGKEIVTTSLFFPIKVEGSREEIEKAITGGTSDITPSKPKDIKLKLKLRAKAVKIKLMLQHNSPTDQLLGLPDTDFIGNLGGLGASTKQMLNESPAEIRNVIALSRKSLSGLGAAKKDQPKKSSDIPTLSFDHVVRNYNKGITEDEIKAWIWYKRNIGEKANGWDAYFISDTEATNLAKQGGLLYVIDVKDGAPTLVPYPIYAYGNMYDRELSLRENKDTIINLFGEAAYKSHEEVIAKSKPRALSIMNPDHRERPKILAISKFSKEFFVKQLREESGVEIQEIHYEGSEWGDNERGYTLQWAFGSWLKKMHETDKHIFKNVTAYQVWEYYIRGKNLGRSLDDSEKEQIEKYVAMDGEELFSRFLHEAVAVDDQQKIDMLWNRTYNGFSSVPYHRIPIGFECSAKFKVSDFAFTPIQREGIAFMNAVGSGIIAYDVGVGKTITAIIALANELHAGNCSRPVIAVPNGTYGKWIREIFGYTDEKTGTYYAGVLSGTKYKLNDWHNLGTKITKGLNLEQAVEPGTITMVTYEGLARIGFGEKVMNDLFNELAVMLAQADKDDEKSARDLEKKKQEYRELIGIGLSNTIADIDKLGFDYLVIDEAHNFKNVFHYVPSDDDGVSRFKINAAKSKRAQKAFFLANYIQRTFGKNVMLLTATPFTNNPIEVFSMLSLVGYDNLKKMGVLNLYSFMETFILQTLEYANSYDGTIVMRHVVKQFNNRLVLQRLIHNHINYKTGEEAGVKRPCKINLPRITYTDPVTQQTRKLPKDQQLTTYLVMTDAQMENQQQIISLAQSGGSLGERMKYVMKALAGSLDNALSPYIYDKTTPDTAKQFVEESPKIHYTVRCIGAIKRWHEGAKTPVSGQVIYANRGKEYFKYIKEYLEQFEGYKKAVDFNGSKVDEVEIITGEVSQDEREFIKDAFLANACKVVIGTSTIREGIDLQKYCTAIFNLYPDWNPTDVKQLEGRGWRQGNTFGYVRVVMPLVQDSMDVFVFQKLEEKTARVNDIWYKADRGNVMDVESLDPEEVKFALYTDINELAKIVIDRERTEIKRQMDVIESNEKSVKALSYSIGQLREFRVATVSIIQDWKVALSKFMDTVAEDPESWSDFSPSKMQEYEERAIELMKEIEDWQSQTPQDDKFIIQIYNRVKDSIFKTKSVLNVRGHYFEQFKIHFLTVAKAEKTIMQQRGYTLDTDFVQAKEDLKAEGQQLQEQAKQIESPENIHRIMEDIRIKKAQNKVDGRIAEAAAEDFISLNHLLAYRFNETDIEGCKIPAPHEAPIIPAQVAPPKTAKKSDLALRLKLKAKAVKVKLLLQTA